MDKVGQIRIEPDQFRSMVPARGVICLDVLAARMNNQPEIRIRNCDPIIFKSDGG